MEQYLIIAITILLSLISFFAFRKERYNKFKLFIKIISVLYLAIGFFRFMLSDSFIWVINKGIYDNVYYESTDILQTILRWGQNISYVVFVMAAFFDSKLFKNISIFICLPFTILNVVFFNDFMAYFMGEVFTTPGRGIQTSRIFRSIYFSTELIIGLTIPLLFIFVDKHYKNLKDKNLWKNFFISLPFVIISLMPVFVPQSLFGYTKITTTALTVGNFVWIFITLVEITILYILFRFKNFKERYMLCMFLALSLFMHYNSLYLMGFSIARLPIQLCNLGAYFFVFALIIKKQAFFNFSFLANIVGTIIAMVAPDTSGGFAGFWNIHFLIEHMQVLAVPMLCMLLRIFKRLETKALKHLTIGFSSYFIFCWISGTLLNGFAEQGGYGKVNFFYIFDLEKAFGYFPFISFTQNVHWQIGRFEMWPIFQLIIYAGFLALCIGFYFFMMKFYEFLDDHFELRKAKIDLYEKITGKKSKAQRDYND